MRARYIFTFIVTAVMFSSCSLKENLTSYSKRENFYRNAKEIETGLNACYSPIRSVYGNVNFFQMTECATDLLYLNSSTQYNAICNITPSRPGISSTVWSSGYQGVSRANTMVQAINDAIENGYVDQAEGDRLMAEAIILRAFHYYLLTSTFGDVPFYEDEVTEENRVKITTLPRMSADQTRAKIIEELWEYLMPASYGGRQVLEYRKTYDSSTDYRMGAAVGLFIGGRMALWNKDWEHAKGFFAAVESIYGDLMKYPLTDVPFSKKYTPESIWEVAQEYEPYGLQMVGGLAGWTTPVRRMVYNDDDDAQAEGAHCFYNGIAIPELGKDSHIYGSARPTAYFYQNLLPYTGSDLRSGEYSDGKDEPRGGSGTLAWRWSGFDPTTPESSWTESARGVYFFTNVAKSSACPWLGNKFWCWDMKYARDYNNYKIFRYAGALLGMAEAQLMGGDKAEALRYLNMTRRRAGIPELTMSDIGGETEILMEEIRCECARELLGEFQRKFDLVRWGIWYDRTVQYNTSSFLQSNIRPCHRFMPIPADQVAKSNGALDNKEYEDQ